MASVMLIVFAVLIVLRTPVAFAMFAGAVAAILWQGNLPLVLVAQRMFNGTDSWPLLAIPLFVFAGALMETGGISARIVGLASLMVGHVRGGLGMVVIVATMLFSGISGSSSADAAAIGSATIPAMIRRKYDPAFATALMAAAGGMGILVPPCIVMIIYGTVAEVSIAGLFAGGFIPALVMGGALMIGIHFMAIRMNLPTEERPTARVAVRQFADALLPMMMPVIIMGGILGGIFTPTEAAVVAVIFGFIVSVVIYKEMKLSQIPALMTQTAVVTGSIIVLIAGANIFGWILAAEQIPEKVASLVLQVGSSQITFLLVANLLFLVAGMLIDPIACVIILAPILLPAAKSLGVDPLHFGILMIANLGIGLITPPMAPTLYIVTSISGVPIAKVVRPLMSFIAIMFLSTLIITYFPELTLILPRLLLGYGG